MTCGEAGSGVAAGVSIDIFWMACESCLEPVLSWLVCIGVIGSVAVVVEVVAVVDDEADDDGGGHRANPNSSIASPITFSHLKAVDRQKGAVMNAK